MFRLRPRLCSSAARLAHVSRVYHISIHRATEHTSAGGVPGGTSYQLWRTMTLLSIVSHTWSLGVCDSNRFVLHWCIIAL